MHIDDTQLKSFMLDSGLVSKKELTEASQEAEEKNESVGKLLVKKGSITDDDLRRMQAYILGIPFVDLKNQKLDFSVLSLIPEPIARNHNIIAFKCSRSFIIQCKTQTFKRSRLSTCIFSKYSI